ncbi:MAG: murein biosynthesis integral membrane protein MurJ [Candidatus Nomurabacteria bacterium]|jgi:putative peptidoglycan lipid II flippase|nr:murein biosynthesis integral membrane protein MurJ [Candidatus Nomurabacteria bacterium]
MSNRFQRVTEKFASTKLSIKLAALVLSSSTLISALLGLFRDRLLNGYYLDTYPTGIDAYTVAFTIPDFMFFILVSGALSVTFIPVFNQRLAAGNKKSAWELSSSLLNLLALVTLVASVLIIIFAEPLVRYVVGPGLDEATRALAVSMMRVIAVNPFLFAISTVLSSMQQAVGRFVFYALAPAIYNIGIIIGTVFFTGGINIFGWQVFDGGIMGVALGVVLGSMMQFIISMVGIIGMGFDYKFKIFWKNMGLRAVLKLLPARSLDQGIDYVNGVVEMNLASHMASGTVRAYQQALTLHMMPINLIGVAISTAFFPKLTESVGEGKEQEFVKDLRTALRMIIWIALPISVMFYFMRGYIVNFIKNGGNALIAGILGALIISIFCRSIFHIASRGFYAQQDTKTPFKVSIFAIGLNILLAIVFTLYFKMDAYGLAYAQSIGAVVEIAILLFILSRRTKKLFNPGFLAAMFKMIISAATTGVITYLAVRVWPLEASDQSFFATFPKFVLIGCLGVLAYLAAGFFLRLDETKSSIDWMTKKLFRKV